MAMVAIEEATDTTGWFGRKKKVDGVKPVEVVFPLPDAKRHLFLVGATFDSLSPRELKMLEEGRFGLATWSPMMRTLIAPSGIGIVVPEEMSLHKAAFCLASAIQLAANMEEL